MAQKGGTDVMAGAWASIPFRVVSEWFQTLEFIPIYFSPTGNLEKTEVPPSVGNNLQKTLYTYSTFTPTYIHTYIHRYISLYMYIYIYMY